MQNDFVTGSLAVPQGATIVDNINTLIDVPGFKTRIATKDFHPTNHVSFAETHRKDVFSKLIISILMMMRRRWHRAGSLAGSLCR
jgi:nicotinamidase-related amidase